jgi:hypothetical protein
MVEPMRAFWLHKPTERLWAVELCAGVVIGAAGPLSVEDAAHQLLKHLQYSTRDVRWIMRERDNFAALDAQRTNTTS